MDFLQKWRQERQSGSRAATEKAGDSQPGLDAFAPETTAPGGRPVSPAPPWRAHLSSRMLPAALGAIVLLQAFPTYVWVQERLARAGVVAAAGSGDSDVASRTDTAPSPLAGMPSSVPAAAAECASAPGDQAAPPTPATRLEARAVATSSSPGASPTLAAGMLAVEAPVAMQVLERGEVVGTTEAKTIMLSAGTHDLEFRNDAVGYSARRTVAVQAGRTARLRLDAPAGKLSVNALPWAEVWVDNRRVGETPIGNLEAAIGPREIVFRHPDLGERRTTVLVTLKEPARVSMDLRQP